MKRTTRDSAPLSALALALPTLLVACGGIASSSGSDAPAGATTAAPPPSGVIGERAPDRPEPPTIPATPFGPAQDVVPPAGACDVREPSLVPRANQQHVWRVTAAGATSIATGNFFGVHHMNELVAAGDGHVAVQTWSGGDANLSGLVIVDESTGSVQEVIPLSTGYVRSGDYAYGRFALAGKANRSDKGFTIWEKSPQPSLGVVMLATLPNSDYASVRVGRDYVYAHSQGALWRIGRNGLLEGFGSASHFTWDRTSEVDSLFWSAGTSIYRVGVAAPIVTLAQDVMALGFDAKQKKLYATTSLGLSRFNPDGSGREDLLHAKANTAPGPVANDAWMYPAGRDEIVADNGVVRFPVNCFNAADLSDVIPYELDTNRRAGRWLSTDPAYPFVTGTQREHFDAAEGAFYTRQ